MTCTADGYGGNQNLQEKGGWISAAFSVSENSCHMVCGAGKIVWQFKNEKKLFVMKAWYHCSVASAGIKMK